MANNTNKADEAIVTVEANAANEASVSVEAKYSCKKVRVTDKAKANEVSVSVKLPLLLFSFSLTKYSTIFANVKGDFGINNNIQFESIEINRSVEIWSKL